MRTSIVVGLGFGDEGKGLMVDQLSRQSSNALVVRFSGGHQCGHTVVKKDGKRHVFSQFGSGTLSGADTFYSKNCTLEPVGLVKEYKALKKLGVDPKIYIDPLCPVVTPYDLLYNRFKERRRYKYGDHKLVDHRHGSCGVGFGATIERHESGVKLFAKDLKYQDILIQKLNAIYEYYDTLHEVSFDEVPLQEEREEMLIGFELAASLMFFAEIANENEAIGVGKYGHYIFEGNQGILLDAEHGFFPNVTRSSTTSKLALEMVERHGLMYPDIYYMHRVYLTRHGNGWLPGEGKIKINPNPNETNIPHAWQGEFRTAPLNLELFQYALDTDNACSEGVTGDCNKTIVFTCMDQLKLDEDLNDFLDIFQQIYPDKYKYLFSNSECSDEELKKWNHG